MGGGGGSQKKVAQNDVKHILVLEFLRSDDFVEGGYENVNRHTTEQPTVHPTNQPSNPTDTLASR